MCDHSTTHNNKYTAQLQMRVRQHYTVWQHWR